MPREPKLDYYLGYSVKSVRENNAEGEGIGITLENDAQIVSLDARYTGSQETREKLVGLQLLRVVDETDQDEAEITLVFGRVIKDPSGDGFVEQVEAEINIRYNAYRLSDTRFEEPFDASKEIHEKVELPDDPSEDRVTTGPSEEALAALQDQEDQSFGSSWR